MQPALGRVSGVDDEGIATAPVAVISYAAWLRRVGGDPGVLGRRILIARQPFTIVGVAPRGFFGVAVGAAPEVTIAVTALHRDILSSSTTAWLHIMARLKPGPGREQADAAFQVLWPDDRPY